MPRIDSEFATCLPALLAWLVREDTLTMVINSIFTLIEFKALVTVILLSLLLMENCYGGSQPELNAP